MTSTGLVWGEEKRRGVENEKRLIAYFSAPSTQLQKDLRCMQLKLQQEMSSCFYETACSLLSTYIPVKYINSVLIEIHTPLINTYLPVLSFLPLQRFQTFLLQTQTYVPRILQSVHLTLSSFKFLSVMMRILAMNPDLSVLKAPMDVFIKVLIDILICVCVWCAFKIRQLKVYLRTVPHFNDLRRQTQTLYSVIVEDVYQQASAILIQIT